MGEGVPVANAIEALRSELEAAMDAGKGSRLRFEATAIEVELQATVTLGAEAGAGVKWWLVDASAKGSAERATTQTIRLTLTPKVASDDGTTQTPLLDGRD
ncbi:trypco2 family protein [Promicromonospora soli]